MSALAKKARLASLLLVAATAYQSGRPSGYLASSDCDMAHRIGLWLRETGRSAPQSVEPGRGYTWRVNGLLLSFANGSVPERIG